MFTKNFKTYLKLIGLSCNMTGYNTPGLIAIKDQTNTTKYAGIVASGVNGDFETSTASFRMSSSAAVGIYVGSGNTPATEDDYNLENIITSGITGSVSGESCSIDNYTNSLVKTLNVLITNTSNTDVTIREIGLKGSLFASTTLGGSTEPSHTICLFERTVLETPVTITPGNSAQIDYKFISKL